MQIVTRRRFLFASIIIVIILSPLISSYEIIRSTAAFTRFERLEITDVAADQSSRTIYCKLKNTGSMSLTLIEVLVNGSVVTTGSLLPITINVGDGYTYFFRYDGPWEKSILISFYFESGKVNQPVKDYNWLVELPSGRFKEVWEQLEVVDVKENSTSHEVLCTIQNTGDLNLTLVAVSIYCVGVTGDSLLITIEPRHSYTYTTKFMYDFTWINSTLIEMIFTTSRRSYVLSFAVGTYWRDQASRLIAVAQSMINQVTTLERMEATYRLSHLLSYAETQLSNAQDMYNRGEYKSAYDYALDAYDRAIHVFREYSQYQFVVAQMVSLASLLVIISICISICICIILFTYLKKAIVVVAVIAIVVYIIFLFAWWFFNPPGIIASTGW